MKIRGETVNPLSGDIAPIGKTPRLTPKQRNALRRANARLKRGGAKGISAAEARKMKGEGGAFGESLGREAKSRLEGELTGRERRKLNRLNKALRMAHGFNPNTDLIQVGAEQARQAKKRRGIKGLWRSMRYNLHKSLDLAWRDNVLAFKDDVSSLTPIVQNKSLCEGMPLTLAWLSNPINQNRCKDTSLYQAHQHYYRVVKLRRDGMSNGALEGEEDRAARDLLQRGKNEMSSVLSAAGVHSVNDLLK